MMYFVYDIAQVFATRLNKLIAFQTNSVQILFYIYLRVLHGDLQNERQAAVVEGLVQSHERSVHAALQQVAAVLPQTDGHHPVDHLLVGPHKHVCGRRDGRRCERVAGSNKQTNNKTTHRHWFVRALRSTRGGWGGGCKWRE